MAVCAVIPYDVPIFELEPLVSVRRVMAVHIYEPNDD